jgi:hypothetical protein
MSDTYRRAVRGRHTHILNEQGAALCTGKKPRWGWTDEQFNGATCGLCLSRKAMMKKAEKMALREARA